MQRARGYGVALRATLLGSALLLVGCSVASSQSVAPPTTAAPVEVSALPLPGAAGVPLDQKIAVTVTNARLRSIVVSSPAGTVNGVLSPLATSWQSAVPLTPTTTYTVKAGLVDAAGHSSSKQWQFTTGGPTTIFQATLIPGDGATVGVGMPVIVKLSAPVAAANHAAFESLLDGDTTPAVAGAWHWFSDTELHWRPAVYWARRHQGHGRRRQRLRRRQRRLGGQGRHRRATRSATPT